MGTNRVSDLTVDELKALIQQTVSETLEQFLAQQDTPEDESEFKPEVAEYLEAALKEKRRGKSLSKVLEDLKLDE